MVRISALAALSLAALASAQTIDSLDPCGQTCYQNALNNAGALACAAMDFACLCPNADFHNSIWDCAQNACPPGYASTVATAARVQCATVAPDVGLPPEREPEPEPPAEAPPATTETPEEPATTETPETTSTDSETSTSTSEATSTSTEAAAKPTKTSKPAEETKQATPTTSAAPEETSSDDLSDETPAAGGLGEAAKIGIGVGISAVVIGLAAVVAWFMLRRRRENKTSARIDRFKISHPMPNSEHAQTYNNAEYDIGDLEMKSQRYEDMLPRTEPRQMV